ncbi:helix-turn-helix transcriptional regulator [Modestobacter marinus]|uniref:helix-turn-helix transcriptional regulator n=1 Tax=Modestobacter marinus TaxID=477641 RepID=UPI0021BC122C|nr:helix-turn-helix domain-containing protein [Modestobacter marinus]
MPEPTADHEPELLTITEAADVLRAPVATLRYWRHLGTGPISFRLGRRVLYRRADLRTWIDAQADQSLRRQPPPRERLDRHGAAADSLGAR